MKDYEEGNTKKALIVDQEQLQDFWENITSWWGVKHYNLLFITLYINIFYMLYI